VNPTQRGFSIIELMVTLSVLLALIGSVFFAFDYGTRGFYQSTRRQDAQAEMTKSYLKLKADLRQTHFRSVLVRERGSGDERRDAVCFSAVRDWRSPESFDSLNGLPKWDRYITYYGTPSGSLVRSLLDPEFPDYSPFPFHGLSEADHLNETPGINEPELQSGYSVITTRLERFEASLDRDKEMVLVIMVLKTQEGRTAETSELQFDISPQNTWPRASGL
jgi:prepilin-type N-terminal cleavage/methylation domain-containing protein